MKKLFVIALLALAGQTLHAQDCGNARVTKYQGLYVFFMCEPAQEYETIFPLTYGVSGIFSFSPTDSRELVVSSVNRKTKKFLKKGKINKEPNAVIIHDNNSATAIFLLPENRDKTGTEPGQMSKNDNE